MPPREPYAEKLGRIKDSVSKQRYDSRKAEEHSAYGRARKDFIAGARFWSGIARGLHWIWQYVGWPIVRFVRWLYSPFYRFVKWTWFQVVYTTDEFGKPLFIKWRAGVLILAYGAFVWIAVLPILECIWDATLYVATARRNEHVYLVNSQEILPEENIHSIQGAHDLPITPQDSIYFRVRPVLFHQLWSLTHNSWSHGPPFFFPDYVSVIPIGISDCVITSYGVRIKLFMREFEIYPDILAISCQPIRGDLKLRM